MEVQACIEARDGESVVDRDIELAGRLGVRATPTVFINGVRLPGPVSMDQLIARIRETSSAQDDRIGRKR
ncbi:MAG: thioredoxin domain-containing protein [Bryobacterales bacterium]|nr:thioredoxin domain-containing protein [Bryobacterales bacterium]MBV9397735.1 thioredoxin domain-containing protein [Bryobacterales bacterium]